MARVVVAMSGGVDSSVTAGLLVEQGHEVIGIHMKLHDVAPGGSAGHCCGLDEAVDARRVADQLGIPFYVNNLREAFKKAVMEPFADDYVKGFTPNPCVQCNGILKFRTLLSQAMAMGASHLATGHYCRITDGPALRKAVDPAKDQSYFLFPMTAAALERTLFPLGAMHKEEVRAHATRMGLLTAEKAESQDVCFLPDDDHTRFVGELNPELDPSGEIVDEAGTVLGYHDAYYRFTVGQRRGLRVALGFPAYVLRVEPDTRRVVVAPSARLDHVGLRAIGCTWFERPDPSATVDVRIRHRGGAVPCSVTTDGSSAEVAFHGHARAVAPGQAAVFYQGDRVLGGGWIREARS